MDQREVWDELAGSWRRLRNKPKEGVEDFLKDRGGLVLDIGCGAGRNMLPGRRYVGVDISKNMIALAKERAKEKGIDAQFVVADAANLPFKDELFDHAIAVGVIHISKEQKRCVSEIKRILKENGSVFLTVWNRYQPRFFFSKREEMVPWKSGGKTFLRYYHLFTKPELRKLLEGAGMKITSIQGSRKKAFKLFPMDIVAVAEKAEIPKTPFQKAVPKR